MFKRALISFVLVFSLIGYSAAQEDEKLYAFKDTVITEIDTLGLIHTKVKVWLMTNKKFHFDVAATDTILYSLKKEKDAKMKYVIIKPNDEKSESKFDEEIKNKKLEADAGAGSYTFEFKNRSLKTNHVIIDLKKVNKKTRTEQIPIEPKIDSVTVILYDTVSRVVVDDTYYLGAKKNIRQEYRKNISFEFVKDSVPSRWMYIVAFGKNYSEKLAAIVDLETQQPVTEPLVALFKGKYLDFPYSKSERLKLRLTGPNINEVINTTETGARGGRFGKYNLSIMNEDEVVGEYVYFKVVAFDLIKNSEIRMPKSEYEKMKAAK